jgi:hypothetical protein
VGTVVVMDNVRAHHTAGVREAIEGVGARLVYLPPYSPDFSPVEHTGSKVKTLVRADEPRTIRAVIDSLRRVFKRITPKDALGWFRSCRRCTNRERAPPYGRTSEKISSNQLALLLTVLGDEVPARAPISLMSQ